MDSFKDEFNPIDIEEEEITEIRALLFEYILCKNQREKLYLGIEAEDYNDTGRIRSDV